MSPIPDDPNQAQAWISGEAPDQTIDFYIPRGNRGATGPQGPMGPSLAVGLVETVTGPVVPGTTGPQGLTGPKGDPGGWVAGSALGTSDLNLIVTPGLYKQDNSANVTFARNYPREAVGGALKVYDRVAPGASASIFQEFIPAVNSVAGTPVTYIRYSYNNHAAWSPWRTFTSARVDQTAGRVMYMWDPVNDREQLIYGDTGVRNVYADQSWIDALTGSGVILNSSGLTRVRRVGQLVELVVVIDKAASGSVTCTAAVPLGFRPAAYWNAMTITSSLGLSRVYHPGGASPIIHQSQAAQLNATFSITYTTNDAWPTTLPGVASGTIPNI